MMYATILALLMAACSSAVKGTAAISEPQQPAQTLIPASAEPAPTTMPNGLVDVGGRKLMFHCTGQGSPTVILESGHGADLTYWLKVQIGGDRSYRVCSYDRANLGDSDQAPTPRTFQDIARDLHALLTNAHIGGPYILVGHSGGGMMIRVFTDQYPEEVVGLVLVDSGHPDMGPRLLAGLPPESLFEPKAIREWRIWLSWMSDSHGSLYKDLEGMDMKASNAQVKAAKPLGDLPLVVISRSPDNPTLEGRLPLPAETNAKLLQIWQDLQSELVGLSSNSTRVIAAHAGHMIPTEEPELIIEAIRTLVNEARSRMGVTMPPALPADLTDMTHTPRILRVVERRETKNGMLTYYDDVYFTDDAGDAVFATVALTSGNLPGNQSLSGGSITASANEQENEAMETVHWVCYSQGTFVIEMQIVDQAINKSEPVKFTFPCPAPKTGISLYLILGLAIGLGLLVVLAWLLVGYRRSRRASAFPPSHRAEGRSMEY